MFSSVSAETFVGGSRFYFSALLGLRFFEAVLFLHQPTETFYTELFATTSILPLRVSILPVLTGFPYLILLVALAFFHILRPFRLFRFFSTTSISSFFLPLQSDVLGYQGRPP